MKHTMSNQIIDPKIRTVIKTLSQFEVDPIGMNTDVEGISMNIEMLFDLLSSEDIGEIIASSVDEGIISQMQGSEFLGIATWSGKSNGAQLQPTLERWLEAGNDLTRIGLSLTQGIFPFYTFEKMADVLMNIATNHPQYAELCVEKINRRRQQRV